MARPPRPSFCAGPAMGAADASKGRRNERRSGRRRIAREQVQITQGRMTQPQGIAREPPPRLGSEERRDRRGRGRQCGLTVRRAPFGERRHTGAVGPPVFLARAARRYSAAAVSASAKLSAGAGRSTMVSSSNQSRTASGSAPAGRCAASAGPMPAGAAAIAVSSTNSPSAAAESPVRQRPKRWPHRVSCRERMRQPPVSLALPRQDSAPQRPVR